MAANSAETQSSKKQDDRAKLASVTIKGSKRKRAYHSKVRTGCITCKYVALNS